MGDGIVETDRHAQVAVEDAGPIVDVLGPEGLVEAVLVAQGGDVGGGGAFAEHLQDRVAGNEVDEEENQGNHDPDHGEGEEQAGEDLLHGLGSTINQGPERQGPRD